MSSQQTAPEGRLVRVEFGHLFDNQSPAAHLGLLLLDVALRTPGNPWAAYAGPQRSADESTWRSDLLVLAHRLWQLLIRDGRILSLRWPEDLPAGLGLHPAFCGKFTKLLGSEIDNHNRLWTARQELAQATPADVMTEIRFPVLREFVRHGLVFSKVTGTDDLFGPAAHSNLVLDRYSGLGSSDRASGFLLGMPTRITFELKTTRYRDFADYWPAVADEPVIRQQRPRGSRVILTLPSVVTPAELESMLDNPGLLTVHSIATGYDPSSNRVRCKKTYMFNNEVPFSCEGDVPEDAAPASLAFALVAEKGTTNDPPNLCALRGALERWLKAREALGKEELNGKLIDVVARGLEGHANFDDVKPSDILPLFDPEDVALAVMHKKLSLSDAENGFPFDTGAVARSIAVVEEGVAAGHYLGEQCYSGSEDKMFVISPDGRRIKPSVRYEPVQTPDRRTSLKPIYWWPFAAPGSIVLRMEGGTCRVVFGKDNATPEQIAAVEQAERDLEVPAGTFGLVACPEEAPAKLAALAAFLATTKRPELAKLIVPLETDPHASWGALRTKVGVRIGPDDNSVALKLFGPPVFTRDSKWMRTQPPTASEALGKFDGGTVTVRGVQDVGSLKAYLTLS